MMCPKVDLVFVILYIMAVPKQGLNILFLYGQNSIENKISCIFNEIIKFYLDP